MKSVFNMSFWFALHKWSSLICTLFMLILCLTGLPLIFSHEIDHWLGNSIEPPLLAADTPRASLDAVIQAARQERPGDVVQYVLWEDDEPDLIMLTMGKRADTPPDDTHTVVVDARTATVLAQPQFSETFIYIMLKLHTDMFAGLPGKLFLGLMGTLFIVSLISGAWLYGPFMRKLPFGAVRREKSPRLKWLDLHNLLGMVALMWMLVVGTTGVICALADLALQTWRYGQLAEMVAPYQGQPPLTGKLASLDQVAATTRQATPQMKPLFIAYPGTRFSSPHHFAFFVRGDSALTSQIWQPVLIDAKSGAVTDNRAMPWYMTGLMISKPLHFGDYGGMPLKILWAILDLITIFVLISGLYLWWSKRKAIAARIQQLEIQGTE